tara:strand:- start:6448 stop:6840 length:393 start_codon:yes stop_codon:yes gene_type:complete
LTPKDEELSRQEPARKYDTSHLNPAQYDVLLHVWHRPAVTGRGFTSIDYFWASKPPDVAQVKFRASGSFNHRRRLFDVHLVHALDSVPLQTWASMGQLAFHLHDALENAFDITVRPIDRTVIDIDYVDAR